MSTTDIKNYSTTIEANTGYITRKYVDTNEFSATAGQEVTITKFDNVACPMPGEEPDWVLISSECQLKEYPLSETTGYTGYVINQYRDMNVYSPSYFEIKEVIEEDEEHCPAVDETPDFEEYSGECEAIVYEPSKLENNSGIYISHQRDVNIYSPTYNSERDERIEDVEKCPIPDVTPDWQEISRACETETYNAGEHTNGKVDVVYEDKNEWSSSYGQQVVEVEDDEENCPSPNIEPNWVEISREPIMKTYPSGAEGYTATVNVTYQDENEWSDTYGNIYTIVEEDDSYPIPDESPDWVEVSRECEKDSNGNNTGFVLVTMKDEGTYSLSWGETMVESVYNNEECSTPATDPIWELKSSECNTVAYKSGSYANDGSVTETYEDVNEASSTYGQTTTRVTYDTEKCPLPDTSSDWVTESTECQQTEYGIGTGNTGNVINHQVDKGEFSSTYGDTRDIYEYNTSECPLPDLTPNWVEISRECDQTAYNDQQGNNGYATVTMQDENELSSTYGQTTTTVVQDLENCPLPDLTANWVEIERYCETATAVSGETYRTGNSVITERDENEFSPTFDNTRTYTEADPTNCPSDDTSARWVEVSRICEAITYYPSEVLGNSGRALVIERDENVLSPTYDTQRTEYVEDTATCPIPDTDPIWVNESEGCQQITYSPGNVQGNSGYYEVVQRDSNEYSSSYNSTRTETTYDVSKCPLPDTTANWVLTSSECEQE